MARHQFLPEKKVDIDLLTCGVVPVQGTRPLPLSKTMTSTKQTPSTISEPWTTSPHTTSSTTSTHITIPSTSSKDSATSTKASAEPALPTILRLRSPATLPAQPGNQPRCKPRLEGLMLPERQTRQHPRHPRQQRKMITQPSSNTSRLRTTGTRRPVTHPQYWSQPRRQ